jgi:CRISPR-associated protein Csm2
MNIYVKIRTPQEYEDAKPDIQYLKVRMAYEAGREDSVKNFLNNTHLRSLVDGVTSYEQFMLYCRYAEALVAYFKFFGGKDK